MGKQLVPVTEEDKQKSYFKYYLEEMAPVAPEIYAEAEKSRLEPGDALPVQEINRLLDSAPLKAERGYCVMPDGSAYMANRMHLEGVTPEMIDWWFAWHGLDPLRYKIWDREDHYYCLSRNVEQGKDPNLSYREKYWNTRHDIIEGFGEEPRKVMVPFIPPRELGVDVEQLERCGGTFVAMASEDCRTISCHCVLPEEGGSMLRSRFWFGWHLCDGKPKRMDDIPMPEQLPKSLLLHNIKEFTNLGRLLPRIFPEEKDHF